MVSTFEEQLDIEYEGFHFVNVITSDDLVYHFTNQKYQKIDGSEQLLSYQYLTLQGSKISALMDDTNADNVPEQLNFDFQLFTDADKIKQVTILLPLRCYFASLHFKFDCYLYFQESEIISGQGLSQLQIAGEVQFYQQEPLPSSNFDIDYYSEIIVDDNLSNQWMGEMLSQIYTRTYSVRPRYISRKIGGNSEKQLRVSIKLDNIKLQLIQRWVSLLAIMKLAWLQYFSVFIIIWIIGREFLIFLFRFRIVDTCKVEQL
ncbi:unnamed protein product (macronuclear) [Paramecium tetraurelia]|uniref:Transmembrane protein 231 n=1 Tax=Paramecium tetraurelia TaxID=5888 RepID=Q6BFD5_PARTE|nr:hypothetical protein [Paramecium tetraurelia strain d4-2]XP_001422994.1 uncharacterized protein GSPATT00000031001 [Paramecium tetraurelia]CAH03636.1 hypothetical protein PTMB.435 [Paramecium tetraurelia]CAK55596.1 unnamed protein product [Paramecium tetraurelia]|eukprot:XP_001422994.1 hypothetical protein (macronuclear) [Paramecium tetraurelia strain d4-2]